MLFSNKSSGYLIKKLNILDKDIYIYIYIYIYIDFFLQNKIKF